VLVPRCAFQQEHAARSARRGHEHGPPVVLGREFALGDHGFDRIQRRGVTIGSDTEHDFDRHPFTRGREAAHLDGPSAGGEAHFHGALP